jgi:hypothetical protein
MLCLSLVGLDGYIDFTKLESGQFEFEIMESDNVNEFALINISQANSIIEKLFSINLKEPVKESLNDLKLKWLN